MSVEQSGEGGGKKRRARRAGPEGAADGAGNEVAEGLPDGLAGRPVSKDPSAEEGAPLPFEEALSIVERAVELLEDGQLPLEESIRQYEKGLAALRAGYRALDEAKRRIEVLAPPLSTAAGGGPAWQEGALHPGLKETLDALDQ